MPKKPLVIYSHNMTTFTPDGALDEDAYRQSIQRLVDSRIGISATSGGSGEGHSLTKDELLRVYRATAAVGKGKVIVESTHPEQHTAKLTIEYARIAIEAGLDRVVLYGPAGMHGYRSTEKEYLHYFDQVLGEIKHPVMLNANPGMSKTKASTVAAIVNKYPQIQSIAMSGQEGDGFFIALQGELKRDAYIYTSLTGSFNTFALGAGGLGTGAGACIVPKTTREYVDRYEAGDLEGASVAYRALRRLDDYAGQWKTAWPRPFKAAMKILKMPGWGLREPYVMMDDAELEGFKKGLLALNIPEIDEQARAVGIR